jgi:hypothetical protein
MPYLKFSATDAKIMRVSDQYYVCESDIYAVARYYGCNIIEAAEMIAEENEIDAGDIEIVPEAAKDDKKKMALLRAKIKKNKKLSKKGKKKIEEPVKEELDTDDEPNEMEDLMDEDYFEIDNDDFEDFEDCDFDEDID